jgi:transcriptional regulator with XRE-family HTH domain
MVITTEGKIKLLLLRSGKNQGDLADYLGVKKQSVSRNMKEDGWRIDTLVEIADFFGAKLDIYLVVDGKRYDTSGLDLSGQLHNLMKDQKVNQTDLGRKG